MRRNTSSAVSRVGFSQNKVLEEPRLLSILDTHPVDGQPLQRYQKSLVRFKYTAHFDIFLYFYDYTECIKSDVPFKHKTIAENVSGLGKMVVQPGGEGAGEADLLEQTSPCLTQLSSLEAASHTVEGKRCQQGMLFCKTNLILAFL